MFQPVEHQRARFMAGRARRSWWALACQAETGLVAQRLVPFRLSATPADFYHQEPILRHCKVVEAVTLDMQSYLLDTPIVLGMVRDPAGATDTLLASGRYTVEVAGATTPARLFAPTAPKAASARRRQSQ